jgi:hypothetical protein
MKTVYQTCDGETFENQNTALDHEAELFDDWVEALLSGDIQGKLSDMIRHFDDSADLTCKEENFYGTPYDMLKESLRMYWESL